MSKWNIELKAEKPNTVIPQIGVWEGVYMQNPSPHLWRHASDFSFPHKLSGAVDGLLSISVYMIK